MTIACRLSFRSSLIHRSSSTSFIDHRPSSILHCPSSIIFRPRLLLQGGGYHLNSLQIPPPPPFFRPARSAGKLFLRFSLIKKTFLQILPLFFPKFRGRGGVSVVNSSDIPCFFFTFFTYLFFQHQIFASVNVMV